MAEISFEIKLLSEDNIDEQLDVFIKSFDHDGSFEETKKWWIKKHYHNPVGKSYIFGAFDKEKLVSINGYMPLKYHYAGKNVNVVQSCESGTLPEYRGNGLWSKVVFFAINYFIEEGKFDFLIGFPNIRTTVAMPLS